MIDLAHVAALVALVVVIWLAVVVLSEGRDLRVPESREKTITTAQLYRTWTWKKSTAHPSAKEDAQP